jgi:hypothetical protein
MDSGSVVMMGCSMAVMGTEGCCSTMAVGTRSTKRGAGGFCTGATSASAGGVDG